MLSDCDFRIKNMIIFTSSDFCATFARLPFETRKQLVQMANYDIDLKVIFRNGSAALMPLMFRDVSYRFIVQSIYYGLLTIEHKPTLKYTVPQIMDFMRQRRMQGYTDDKLAEMHGTFYEYHNYSVKTNFTTRLTLMILASAFATLVTNPVDVCLSKILT